MTYLMAHGRRDDALKVVERYEAECRKLKDPGLAQDCVASLYAELKDERAGLALARRVLAEDASSVGLWRVTARLKYAKFLAQNRSFNKAEKLYKEALALARAEQEDIDESASGFGGAVHNAHLQRVSESYGDFLVSQKRLSEAEKMYDIGLQDAAKDPGGVRSKFDDSWRIRIKFADALVAQNRTQEALQAMASIEPLLKSDDLNEHARFYVMKSYSDVLKSAKAVNADRYAAEMEALKKHDPGVIEPIEDYYAL